MPQSPPMTIPYAREQLSAWMAALEHCASGSTYSIAGRALTRQDVPTIRAEIQRWHNAVAALEQHAAGTTRPLGARASFDPPGGGSGGLVGQSTWQGWQY